MRVIVFIVTTVIQLASAAVGFLVLLLVMNGYSEAQATPGLILYIALGLVSAVGLGIASGFAAKRLIEKRSFGGLAASVTAIISSFVLGVLFLVATFVGALAAAEIMRGLR